MGQLDTTDRNIVRLLRLNARMSNVELARGVGLSPSACLRRIRRLEQDGVLLGYTALVNHSSPEAMMVVIVSITLERQTKEYMARFEAALLKHPEIRDGYLMTGGADYILHVEIENPSDFERIHTEVLSTLPGVARIQSSFGIRNVMSKRGKRAK